MQLVPQQATEDFDKRLWMLEISKLKKDYFTEERARFMPLVRVQKDPLIKAYMEEVERTEKKN